MAIKLSVSRTPIAEPDDPAFLHENAVFHALGFPANRRILELLVAQPLTEAELAKRFRYDRLEDSLAELTQVGFLEKDGVLVRLSGPAIGMVKEWISRLP
jgi:hypothetical protein